MPNAALDAGSIQDVFTLSFAGVTLADVVTAVVATVVCLVVIKVLLKVADRALGRMHMEPSLKRVVRGVLKALLLFVGVIVVMGCLNIPVTSLVAVLSVIGLALSLALQNFLSNVAGGMQLLASRPFKVGDYVDAGGSSGTVREIGVFYTKLVTPDNKLVQLPNSSIVAANIINYSSEDSRRVELKVTASYDAPTESVKAALARLVADNPLVLADPEPMVRVSSYQDSAIEYVVRVWCANKDYWTVYFDLVEGVRPAFAQAGIEMTYPHLNVHMM